MPERITRGPGHSAANGGEIVKNPVMRMRLYWIEFDRSAVVPPGCTIGCGVTARSKAEVMELLEHEFSAYVGQWIITKFIEDFDYTTIDPNHVRGNSGSPFRVGIWFPNYGDSRRFRL